MMVPPPCLAAWRIVARWGRLLAALVLLVVLSILGAGLAITVGFLLLALATAAYVEVVRAIRSAE